MTAVHRRDEGLVTVLELEADSRMATLGEPLALALDDALAGVEAERPDLRCLMLVGRGPAFLAGADVKAMRRATPAENVAMNQRLTAVGERIAALPVPVVCGLNGHAFGGGLELALACTVRIASADARFGLPEVKIGLVPGSGGLWRLPEVVGRTRAVELVVSGRAVDADEALRIGLVDEVVPAARVAARALERAREIAGNAPLAVREALAILRELDAGDRTAAVARVHAGVDRLWTSADMGRGIDAFLAGESPRFRGN